MGADRAKYGVGLFDMNCGLQKFLQGASEIAGFEEAAAGKSK
jgi:hypothetical protein